MDGTALGRAPKQHWALAPGIAQDTQGFVVSAFAHLPVAVALFLDASGSERGWLRALRQVAPITTAAEKEANRARSAAIAITATGLERLGLGRPTVRASFERPFWEGMHHPDRRRRLGDLSDRGLLHEQAPRWSCNPPGADRTELTVHALLVLYARDEQEADAWARQVTGALQDVGVRVACRLPLSLRFDPDHVAREHFGFADGISQPIPYGPGVAGHHAGQARDPWHGVPLGEFLFGHINAHDEPAPGPLIPVGERENSDLFDLGRNGSYLVVRELHQYVEAFWDSMQAAAADLRKDAVWLAERVVGRERDGDLLLPDDQRLARTAQGPDNAFGFFGTDRHGLGCPLGSHVRRANPRDGLAPDAAACADALDSANNHRLLRRGRKFGPDFQKGEKDGERERGLLFMALNTDITRQFEFIQQTWVLNKSFATLQGETDPLCGPAGPFTVPDRPLRWKVDVQTFVRFAGGEYFFLPGIGALDWLQDQG
jgi:Dyp-type peroxidase family